MWNDWDGDGRKDGAFDDYMDRLMIQRLIEEGNKTDEQRKAEAEEERQRIALKKAKKEQRAKEYERHMASLPEEKRERIETIEILFTAVVLFVFLFLFGVIVVMCLH